MNYNKKSIEDIDVAGKRVLCRCDFNVPTKNGKITSDKRIVAAMPTIEYLVNHGAKVILCSHMGKPKGEWKPELSLKVVADRISELLGKPVIMAADVAGEDAKAKAAALKDGDVMMLENTRFYKEEQGKLKQKEGQSDEEFKAKKAELKEKQQLLAKKFASYGDIYCNDAFGSAHRAHASTAVITKYMPVSVAGFLMEKEIAYLGSAVENPVRPFVAILGGAKVSDKLAVVQNLLGKVDTLIIGGGMAYTFLKAQGHDIGASLCELDQLDYARDMIAKAKERGVKLLLPPTSLRRMRPRRSSATRFRPAGWRWTSVRRPPSSMPKRSRAPRRLSGTGRWACLSSRPLPPARKPLLQRWRSPERSRSSAAAIRRLRSRSSVSPIR